MTQNAEEQDNDPREAKRVVTEETVVPSQPVEETVEKTETTQRTETSAPPTT
jgi:hypothetical protein